MRSAVLVLTALAGLSLCAPAQAVRVVRPDGHTATTFQRWANHAKVPTPSDVVTVDLTTCPTGAWACYVRAGQRIYLDPTTVHALLSGERTGRLTARLAFYHELYHDFDETGQLDGFRRRFMRIMRLSGPWRARNYERNHDRSPNEVFANGAAACAVKPRIGFWDFDVTGGNYQPTPRQHRRVCNLVRRAGR